jgi:hypothetical protein
MNYLTAGFEVLAVVTMKSMVSWVVMTCRSDEAQHFGVTYCLCLQGLRVSQARNQQKQVASSPQLNFLSTSVLDLLFNPEDRGTMFL